MGHPGVPWDPPENERNPYIQTLQWSLILWFLQGTSNDGDEKNYNNAFEMMPTFGMLHKASSGFMTGNFRKMSGEPSENNGQGQDNKAMDHMESIGENIWF